MNRDTRGHHSVMILIALVLGPPAVATAQQHVVLDKPVKAGDLTLFPSLDDSTAYYYVVDKPRLATDANGEPQFSFLRYVENVRSTADQPEIREGEGGGIFHALVSLSVSDDQLQEARRELRRIRPGARVMGPVMYKSGKFGLVTSFKDPQGNLARQVVGLGSAPILDGEKAAISIQLTKLGGKLLWESFHTAAPDISFSFEMEIEGYSSPKRAIIDANWDQIYDSKAFGAGIATTYLAGEIKAAFDDLTRQGAIKVTQIGSDERLESLLSTAYGKIADAMFQPVQGTGTPDFEHLMAGAQGGGGSLLDRATNMLKEGRAAAREENAGIRERNAARRNAQGNAAALRSKVRDLEQRIADADERAKDLEQQGDFARQRAADLRQQATAPGTSTQRSRQIQTLAQAAERSATTLQQAADGAKEEVRRLQDELTTARAEAARAEAAARDSLEQPVSAPSFAAIAVFEMKQSRQHGIYHIDLNKYTSETISPRFDENIGDLHQFVNNPLHFREVNTDDPLYKQREIVAFVDGLNTGDFGKYVNFVTVQLRKRHQSGEETPDEVRIDRNNFNKEGNNFKLLYGWKGDNDRRRWMEYDYKLHWSFFGGTEIDEPWHSATAGAIAVAPPLQIRRVALEGSPQDLQTAGVRSITVKIYYRVGDTERTKQLTLDPSRDPISGAIEFMLPVDRFEYEYEVSWRLQGSRTVSTGRRISTEGILFLNEIPET